MNFKVLYKNQVYEAVSFEGNTLELVGGRILDVCQCTLLPNTGYKDIDGKSVFLGDVIQSAGNPNAACFTIEFKDGEYWGVPKRLTALGDIVPNIDSFDTSWPMSYLVESYDYRVVGDYWSFYLSRANRIKRNIQAVKDSWEEQE